MRFNSINIYSAQRSCTDETRKITGLLRCDSAHIVDMYTRLFKYYSNAHCKSLNIAADENTSEWVLEPICDGFTILHMPFKLHLYSQLTDIQKSEYWLEALHNAIGYVGNLWGWELSHFENIPQQIREANFCNRWRYGKYSPSPSGYFKASLWVEQNLHSTKIYLIIYKGRQKFGQYFIQETDPPDYAYGHWLGPIQWHDNRHLTIIGYTHSMDLTINE